MNGKTMECFQNLQNGYPLGKKSTFMCKFCNVTLQLGNVGITALRKHMKYEKHLKIAENNDTQMKL